MAIEPDERQIAEITALAGDGDAPVVMLNLNRYRDREEYLRYGAVALTVLERVGGRILWAAEARQTVVGDGRWDEVLAVWYPSASAFLELASDADLLAARQHRVDGLEEAELICCDASGYAGTLSSDDQR
jgi:uncharacterized protein (DUF1330 family)